MMMMGTIQGAVNDHRERGEKWTSIKSYIDNDVTTALGTAVSKCKCIIGFMTAVWFDRRAQEIVGPKDGPVDGGNAVNVFLTIV